MAVDPVRELDAYDMSRPREGEVAAWVRWTVILASAVTIAIVVLAPRLMREQGNHGARFDSFWFRNGLALGVAGVLAVACLPLARVSQAIRLALVLPILHLAVMVVAWIGWTELKPMLGGAVELTPLLMAIPISQVLVAVAGVILTAGIAIAFKKRGEAIHAVVMIALVDLLLLGVWLPIVSTLATDSARSSSWTAWDHLEAQLASPAKLVALVLAPPLIGAIAYTWLAIRRPAKLRAIRGNVIKVVGFAWVVALVCRANATDVATVIYSNFLPWLLASAVAAVGAITALSVVTWVAQRRGRHAVSATSRQHVGAIVGERGALAAGFEITSWLRGPRAIVTTFDVTTPSGEVPVPAGACLVAPLPLASTLLRTGETIAVLRGGDEVALSGYEQHSSGQPFRDSAAPIPGTHGVYVGAATPAASPSQLALVAWRPAVAYLVILVVVAIPALVSVLQPH